MKKGNLIIVSGPSGVGKDTIISNVLQSAEHQNAVKAITTTTRPPRENEVDGRDYFFLSEIEFLRKVASDGFLEFANFAGNWYGSPKDALEELQNVGKDVLMVLDVQGVVSVRSKIQATFVFIAPPSLEDLESRLRTRKTDADEVIARRLLAARHEMQQVSHYDYLIVNDDIDDATADLKSIIRSVRCKVTQYF